MSLVVEASETAALDLARECVYRFLAAALSNPRRERFQAVRDTADQELACQAAAFLREEVRSQLVRMGLGELPPESLKLELVCQHLRELREDTLTDYDRVFGLAAVRGCPPFETEYHPNSDPFFRSQQMADIAGFYRAFGLSPGAEVPERPDHIVLELEFLAFLFLKQRLAASPEADEATLCAEANNTFFLEHMAWWVPAFASGLRRNLQSGYYSDLSQVLSALIHVERRLRNLDTPTIPGVQEPVPTVDIPGACGDPT